MRENEPENVRMKKRCLPAMNSINGDLKFTKEAPYIGLCAVVGGRDPLPHILRKGNEKPVYCDAEVSHG